MGLLNALFVGASLAGASACAQVEALDRCEWCGAMDAPANGLTSVMVIADDDEPGERIILHGRVLERDGVTPAPNVLVYAYHTDATGVYRREGGETGNARRHGVLRGWLRTDDEGRYEIRTIRPGSYPSRSEPAHIHVTLTPPDGEEHWVASFNFSDDPLLSEREKRQSRDAGRFGAVMDLVADENDVLVGERDLQLQ